MNNRIDLENNVMSMCFRTSAAATLTATAIIALALPAQAEMKWTTGLGLGVAPDYEGSDDYQAVPLWNLRLDNLYDPNTFVHILGPKLRSNLLPVKGWRLGPMLEIIAKRDDDVDDNRVDKMKDVDMSVMPGVVGGYDWDLGGGSTVGLEAQARWDAADNNGFLGTLGAAYGTPFAGSWFFHAGVETTYANDNYMESYFDVDAEDSRRSGLDEYSASAGFKDVGANVSLLYSISDSWSVQGLASYTRLLNDAEDSPVVDDQGDENQFFGGLLVNFHF